MLVSSAAGVQSGGNGFLHSGHFVSPSASISCQHVLQTTSKHGREHGAPCKSASHLQHFRIPLQEKQSQISHRGHNCSTVKLGKRWRICFQYCATKNNLYFKAAQIKTVNHAVAVSHLFTHQINQLFIEAILTQGTLSLPCCYKTSCISLLL